MVLQTMCLCFVKLDILCTLTRFCCADLGFVITHGLSCCRAWHCDMSLDRSQDFWNLLLKCLLHKALAAILSSQSAATSMRVSWWLLLWALLRTAANEHQARQIEPAAGDVAGRGL